MHVGIRRRRVPTWETRGTDLFTYIPIWLASFSAVMKPEMVATGRDMSAELDRLPSRMSRSGSKTWLHTCWDPLCTISS